MNASRGMQTGADEDKIREVPGWRESHRFSDVERTALEYAEAMTITGQRVSDELFARLRAHFDEAQIVELTAAVALENFRSKFNVPLQIESQGFCLIKKNTELRLAIVAGRLSPTRKVTAKVTVQLGSVQS